MRFAHSSDPRGRPKYKREVVLSKSASIALDGFLKWKP